MFHVPGQYSGDTSQGYKWTQTKSEVELRVPLPAGLPDGSVTCVIEPRAYRLAWPAHDGAAATEIGGGLSAGVVVDDSLWSVDADGAGKTVVISLRKTVPDLWDRLLADDPEAAEAPRLLDGLERSAPRSKEQLLKDAKKRAGAALDGPSKAQQHVVEDHSGETIELAAAALPALPVITVRRCTDCEISVPAGVAAVKLMFEGCTRCTLAIDGKVLTETLEVWRCEACTIRIATRLATIQVDACTGLDFAFVETAQFDRLLTAGAYDVSLGFGDAPALRGRVDLGEMQAEAPEKDLNAETDQFITRIVDGGVLTELIIRLSNDFPTTEREVADFAARTKMHADKLDGVVDGMLGSTLGRHLTDAEREQMKQMVRDQSDQAAAAQHQTEQTAAGRHMARVDFKKSAGNDAFKSGDYQQAAVLYTEAIALDDSAAPLYSNRAACFLKLGRYAQAREDAQKCTELNPDFAKGHFRLALALQAEQQFQDACHAFNRALKLEPKNKDALSGLRMAEVQAERQRRQQAA